ncbi:hypothetical protein [Kitasatospora sp. NBC_01266]|uniref:hypothetical protein n=1 Tax=Kitasatospora sp. NBC_01266 TaxID=2903572 RepID=UPI002E364DB0|nr:hypothetical protein [Kitasatospora sp. NBC_01266]
MADELAGHLRRHDANIWITVTAAASMPSNATTDRTVDRPVDRTVDRPVDRTVDRPVDRTAPEPSLLSALPLLPDESLLHQAFDGGLPARGSVCGARWSAPTCPTPA